MNMLTDSASTESSLLELICKKRSIRHEECSGPAPSNPCGNNITKPKSILIPNEICEISPSTNTIDTYPTDGAI